MLRSARVVSLGTLLSRVLGLLRDTVLAHVLGAGAAADAFAIAYRVPNLLRELLGEGALTSAFLPAYAGRVAAGDREGARRLYRTVLTLLTALLAVLTAAAVLVFLSLPVEWLHPRDAAAADKYRLLLDLAAWCMPYAPLVCVTAVMAAVLQAEGRFGAPALAPAAMNLFWVGGMLVFLRWFPDTPEGHARAVAAGVLVGGTAQAATCLRALHSLDLLPRPTLATKDPALRVVMHRLGPAVAGLAPVQVNLLVAALIAERFIPGDGANSALYYSGRLLQLPLSLVGVSVAVAGFPLFSRLAAEGRRGDLGRSVADSLRAVTFLSIPAAAGLAALALPVVTLLYRHGRFAAEDAAAAAEVLQWSLLGLPAFTALQVVTRAFHAVGDTMTPVRVGVRTVVVNLALNLLLVGPMEAPGLALAAAITAWGNLAVLVWLARTRLRLRGMREVAGTVARVLGPAAACALAAMAGAGAAADLLAGHGFTAAAGTVAAGVACGATAFLIPVLAFRMREGREFARAWRK